MKMLEKNIPGGKETFYLRQDSSDAELYNVLIDQDEYGYIQFAVSPKVIVDVGANIGLSSVYFSIRYPEAKIYALEPALDNFDMLKKNTAPYTNIVPILGALMANEGFGTIYDPGQGDLAYRVQPNNNGPGKIKWCAPL